jgi:FMN phosphatase YigB (HAD superfamily)
MPRGLILDLDNTLYSWVDAFLPSFRGMVHKLASELGLEEEEILDDFREVYRRYGTVEYPNAVKELGLWDRHRIPEAEQIRVGSIAEKVFSINYRRHLHLFPGVIEVLEWTRREGITVVGLSDALERWVCYRLRMLGVEKYFAGLYTWHDEPWFDERRAGSSSVRRVRLTSSELKPNAAVVERVLRDFGLDREQTYMVGDSLSKDVAAAQVSRVHDVWARYGTKPQEVNLETLRRITPWTESERSAEQLAKHEVRPTEIIDGFSQLVDLMGTCRPTLFD